MHTHNPSKYQLVWALQSTPRTHLETPSAAQHQGSLLWLGIGLEHRDVPIILPNLCGLPLAALQLVPGQSWRVPGLEVKWSRN